MSRLIAGMAQPALTIHFQGICAFLRNKQNLAATTEVTVVFVAGQLANETPKLCAHTPVLVFDPFDFLESTGGVTHTTALIPGPATPPCPSLGIWPLAGRNIQIAGAPAGSLSLSPSFGSTSDLSALFPGGGAASGDCLLAQPPATRLVGGRFALTSGTLSVTQNIGGPDEQWVFDAETAQPTTGQVVNFAQEVQYEYFSRDQKIVLEAVPFGSTAKEQLALKNGAKVAISQLCPIELGPIDDERDFLAYYALLANVPTTRLIPHRLRTSGGGPIRIGVSACPPMTTFV